MDVLLIVNCVIGLATAAMGVVGLVKPGAFSRSQTVEAGEKLYARMYAARGIPLGIAAGFVPLIWSSTPTVSLAVLIVAVVAQIGDVIVGARARSMAMVGGAAVAAVIHAVAALALVW